jgi:hypothetical protein
MFVHFVWRCSMPLISIISWLSVLLVEETGGRGENHYQGLSHNVVHIPLIEIPTIIRSRPRRPPQMYIEVAEHQINNYNIIQINVSSFHFIVVILKTCLPDTVAKIYNLHSYICFLNYNKLETIGLFLGRRIWILTLRKTQIISMINSPINKCRKKYHASES